MRIEFDATEILNLKIALSRYLKGFENRKRSKENVVINFGKITISESSANYEYKTLYKILKVFESAYKRIEKEAKKG